MNENPIIKDLERLVKEMSDLSCKYLNDINHPLESNKDYVYDGMTSGLSYGFTKLQRIIDYYKEKKD